MAEPVVAGGIIGGSGAPHPTSHSRRALHDLLIRKLAFAWLLRARHEDYSSFRWH